MKTVTRSLAARVPMWLTRIESASMAATLRPGQLALTTRLRRISTVRRGDLVVVDSLELGRRIVKRVIGLPGDRIVVHDGQIYVDNVLYREPYATGSVFNGTFQVPAGRYFLLGDNREASTDSRTWAQPYISRDEIAGRVHLGPAIRRRAAERYGRAEQGAAVGGPRRAARVAGARPRLPRHGSHVRR